MRALANCLRRCQQLGIPPRRYVFVVKVASQTALLFEKPFAPLQCCLPTSSHSAKILERGIYSASTSDGSSARRIVQAVQRGESRSGINSALRIGCGSAALRLCVKKYRCSTSRFGIGQTEGSNCTPLGLHRIAEKIGGGWPVGTVFKSRQPVGFTWRGMSDAKVTTRILWLEGLEPGFNRGGNVDSHTRYIYIHGTGDETTLGRPASCGCIHLAADDLIPLFDKLPSSTLVWISER